MTNKTVARVVLRQRIAELWQLIGCKVGKGDPSLWLVYSKQIFSKAAENGTNVIRN